MKRKARGTAVAKGRSRRAGKTKTGEVRIYPNDPESTVGVVPAMPLPRAPGEPPFVIEGRRYAPAPYEPGTLAFQYWQGEVALGRAIRVWEDLFERDFGAWQNRKPLRVKLRAGKDLNAFYDRKSLQFFYDQNRVTKRTVYTAESLDIVTHEAGHAILDVYQPGYWSTIDLETAAFHESFGDCTALLVTLTDPAVRRAFLDETKGAARTSNLVSRLAEALGRAIHDNYGTGAVGDPSRLRDANNTFRYAPPDTLLPNVPEEELSGEPHSFSRVFTGAFYDLLIWLLAREAKQQRGVEGLERARKLAGRLLARAVETLPPGDARFGAVALRMREIDQTEEGGVASIGLEEAFALHGMPLPALAARRRGGRRPGRRGTGTRPVAPSTHALRALDPDRPGGAAALRAVLGVHGRARLERTTLPGRIGRGDREQFIHRDWVRVPNPSLGRRGGVWVRVICGCTLTRGPSGDVDGASVMPHPHPTARDLARQLRCWIAFDAIETGRATLRTSRQHFRERKPFRVTKDGVLERVYFE